MADLTRIFSGMESGPEAIQSNFEKMNQTVENMGGQLSGLNWSDLTTAGLVANNDWEILPTNRNSGYQTTQLGNKKLVWLHPILSRRSDFTGSHTGFFFNLPENIEPDTFRMGGDIDADREWSYIAGNGIAFSAYNENASTLWKQGDLQGFSVFYLAKN